MSQNLQNCSTYTAQFTKGEILLGVFAQMDIDTKVQIALTTIHYPLDRQRIIKNRFEP